MKLPVTSSKTVKKRILQVATTAALAAGVFYGPKVYNIVKMNLGFPKNASSELSLLITKDISESYPAYQDIRKQLFFKYAKEKLDSIYLKKTQSNLDSVMTAMESRYKYSDAIAYIAKVEKTGLKLKIDSWKSRIGAINPSGLLEKSNDLSEQKKISFYESILKNDVFPDKNKIMRDSLQKWKIDYCLGFLRCEARFDIQPTSNVNISSVDRYVSNLPIYESYIKNIDQLTPKQENLIRNAFEGIISQENIHLETYSKLVAITHPKINLTNQVRKLITTRLEALLEQDTISIKDIGQYNLLVNLNDKTSANYTKKLDVAYIRIIPKRSSNKDREYMLSQALDVYSIEDKKDYYIAAIKSITPETKVDSIKYALMLKGLR